MTQLTWFDRQGKRTGTVGDPGYIQGVSLAPSGRRAAVFRDTGGNVDLWTVDLTTGIVSRLTSDPAARHRSGVVARRAVDCLHLKPRGPVCACT